VNAGVATFAPYALATEMFDQLYDINVKARTSHSESDSVSERWRVGDFEYQHRVTKGMEGASIYASTKAAVRSFVRTAARECCRARFA